MSTIRSSSPGCGKGGGGGSEEDDQTLSPAMITSKRTSVSCLGDRVVGVAGREGNQASRGIAGHAHSGHVALDNKGGGVQWELDGTGRQVQPGGQYKKKNAWIMNAQKTGNGNKKREGVNK